MVWEGFWRPIEAHHVRALDRGHARGCEASGGGGERGSRVLSAERRYFYGVSGEHRTGEA